MQRIQLLTAEGRHVAYVEIVEFPPTNKPQVVTWGSRVFVRGPSDSYVEAFAVTSLTASPGVEGPAPVPVPPVDRSAQVTTDGRDVDEVRAEQRADGNKMHKSYIVLSDEERKKGFVRPVRRSYRHLKCGSVTTMGQAIAETYARSPDFYGSTMCVTCNAHYPVGEDGEFVWDDGSNAKVGA